MGLVGLESSEMILGTLLTAWIVQKSSDPWVWLQDRLPHALRMALKFLIQEYNLFLSTRLLSRSLAWLFQKTECCNVKIQFSMI